MNKIPSRFYVQFIIFLSLALLFLLPWGLRKDEPRLQQAQEAYVKGETATTIFSRKEAFNKALDLFLQLERDYHPEFGNGKLSFDIGNTYFQLEEYPLALLYYRKTENLKPRSDIVKRNLLQTYQKLELKPPNTTGLVNTLSLKPWLSLPERLQLTSITALLALIFASVWIWTKKRWSKQAFFISLFILVPLVLALAFTHYLSPIEAVLIRSSDLRRDAGMEYAKVSEHPLKKGSPLEVIGISPNRKWVKVATPEGQFGYLPNEAIRLIDGLASE